MVALCSLTVAQTRKEGHVVPVVSFDAFRLHACLEDGQLEDQVIEFAWDTITTFELEEEGMSFMFQYRRVGKPDRWVRIYSHFFVFLFECFEKIQEEIGWTRQLEEHGQVWGTQTGLRDTDRSEGDLSARTDLLLGDFLEGAHSIYTKILF